jgi:hypothetical protein
MSEGARVKLVAKRPVGQGRNGGRSDGLSVDGRGGRGLLIKVKVRRRDWV